MSLVVLAENVTFTEQNDIRMLVVPNKYYTGEPYYTLSNQGKYASLFMFGSKLVVDPQYVPYYCGRTMYFDLFVDDVRIKEGPIKL